MKSLRQYQNETFDLLLKFDEICKKNNAKYSLAFGTLLGAVRHQGFIPWDDDIDLMMESYELDKVLAELKGKYKIESMIDNYDRPNLYSFYQIKVIKVDTDNVLDIFIFEKTSDNRLYQLGQSMFMRIYTMINSIERGGLSKRNRGILSIVWKSLNYSFGRLFRAINLSDKLNMMYLKNLNNTNKNDYFLRVLRMIPLSREDIYPLKKIVFEGKNLPVINNYEKFLKLKYNKYWILPEEKDRVPIHSDEFSYSIPSKENQLPSVMEVHHIK